ncbi:hypothetical protein [uncultured Tateyamaria sp.]|uniref:hypothetical protein n=1 Tax=uncultured Tateyamaria sp. TaxID=455651 RepID=UPI0026158EE0|nr:hypothetical protein [uncultured Tateyamaria sp.]
MMTRQTLIPTCLGLVMGAMMLFMLHRQIMSPEPLDLTALLVFVGAHAVAALVLLAAPFIASPRLRAWLARVHRPSRQHATLMLGGAALGGAMLHVFLHGFGH